MYQCGWVFLRVDIFFFFNLNASVENCIYLLLLPKKENNLPAREKCLATPMRRNVNFVISVGDQIQICL